MRFYHSVFDSARGYRRAVPGRFTWALTGSLILAAGACSEDSSSPLSPESTPELSASATATTLQFRQVSGAERHTCGVTTDNRAYCWGANFWGQLGDGSTQDRTRPSPVAGNLLFRSVSAGSGLSCGVTTTSRVYCWGPNLYLGTLRTTPVAVAGNRRYSQVEVGGWHACAIAESDGSGWCWGSNISGKLGDGTTTDRQEPTAVAGGHRFRQIALGTAHSCGVTTAGVVLCWGSDHSGQLGDGSTAESRLVPTRIASARKFRQVEAGNIHSCAVTTGNRGFCWGHAGSGQTGDGTTTDRYTPRAVAGGLQIERLNAGGDHTCAEVAGNQVYCWGSNNLGQFGNGTTQRVNARPVLAAGGRRFVQIAGGASHTCGVTSSGAALCWGGNSSGQLGNGTSGDRRTTPVRVASP